MKETTYSVSTLPRNLKLCLLADFHNRPNPFILKSLRCNRPDLICIAGDVLYSAHPLREQNHVLPFLSACVSVAPTFLSLGNHEQALSSFELKQIANTGVVVLDNKFISTSVAVETVVIGGLTSGHVTAYRHWKKEHPNHHRPEEKLDREPDTAWLTTFAAKPGYHILLSHHPEYFPLVPSSINLMLSGHTHGGQWRYYSLFKRRTCGLFAPGQGWWPRYSKGVYENRLIVSTGLSNTAGVPRIWNPTEVVYISSSSTAFSS